MNQSSNNQPKFLYSSQPEIIRLNQKDEEYKFLLNQQFLDAVEIFVPHIISYRLLNNHTENIKLISSLIYYALTTLTRRQTLGEEYSNLAQYKESDFVNDGVLTSPRRRLLFYLLTTLSQFFLRKLLKNRYNSYRERVILLAQSNKYIDIIGQNNQSSFQKIVQSIVRNLPDYDQIVDKIFKIHLVLFFVQGIFFQISKRITNIQYIYTKKPKPHQITYKRIGYLLLFQLLCEFIMFIYRVYQDIQKSIERQDKLIREGMKSSYENNDQDKLLQNKHLLDKNSNEDDQQVDESSICGLCFDRREHTAVTPCGHLFCWKCIIKSCSIKPECPQCRQPCKAQKVVQLRNYA